MKKFEFNKEAKSNLAKLLATENLTVEHKKVKTAYFDLQKRLLVVPIWKEMNVDILDLLLAHEIGHALFTPQVEWKEAIDKKIPHSFLNVVEDAAHACGTTENNQKIGSHSDFVCFSFHPVKNLAMPKGGAICINHKKAKMFKTKLNS